MKNKIKLKKLKVSCAHVYVNKYFIFIRIYKKKFREW